MKLLVFSVFDSAAEAYLQPFFARARGEALRGFAQAASDEGHQFSKHADDYTLFQIGEFNDATGELTPCVPLSLGVALEYRQGVPGERLMTGQLDLEDEVRRITKEVKRA